MDQFGFADCPSYYCKHRTTYFVKTNKFLRSKLCCFCLTSLKVSHNIVDVKWKRELYASVDMWIHN